MTVCAQTGSIFEYTELAEGAGEFYYAQQIRLRLDFYDEAIVRTLYDNGGRPTRVDEVAAADVVAALADLEPGAQVLPRDTVYCTRRTDWHVGTYVVPRTASLHVDGEEPVRVPLPPLLLCGHGDTYYVYALATTDWPDAATQLYRAPFPNIYPGGRVCRGTVPFVKAAPAVMGDSVALFLESSFNRDLSTGKVKGRTGSVVDFWHELVDAGAEEYPLDRLVEENVRLEDLLCLL